MIQLIIDLVTPLLVNFGASAADVASYLTSLSTYIYVILGSLLAMIVVMVVAHCAKKGNRHVIRWTAAIAWVLVVLLVVNLICYGPMNSIVSGFLNASKAEMSDDVVGNSKEVIAKVGDEGMVLVKNNGLLPLAAEDNKLNVFGWASVYPVYAGTGSGNAGDAMQPTSMLLSLRDAGFEYGAKTGRPRRVGPIDLVATRYGVRCQGATCIALTKMDVMGYMDKIPVCVHYELDGKVTDEFPFPCVLPDAKPVMEYLPGWKCDISAARTWEELPQEARDYVEYIEKNVGCHIGYVSVGPERDSIIVR